MKRLGLVLGLGLVLASPFAMLQGGLADGRMDLKTEPKPDRPYPESAADGLGCSLGAGTTPLTDGVGTSGSLTTDVGASCEFSLVPTAATDTIRVVLTLTTSDFDLFLKKGSAPTTAVFDCRPFLGGTASERCDLPVTSDDTWFIMVRRFSGSGGFTVTASTLNTCSLGRGPHVLTSGTAQAASVTLDLGASCAFQFTAGATDDLATVTMTPALVNLDLYVRKGTMPAVATGTFDCRPLTTGTATETCSISGVDGTTTIFMMVRRPMAGAGSNDLSITATGLSTCSLGGGVHDLTEAVGTSATLTKDAAAACTFVFAPSATAGFARLVSTLTTDNFDLYVRKNAVPTTTTFDCRPLLAGVATETCDREAEADGSVLFAVVRRPVAGVASASFTLTGTSESGCSLGLGVHDLADGVGTTATLATNPGSKCYFRFDPLLAADFARFALELTTSDFDLYVRQSLLPTIGLWECRPFKGGTAAEECNMLVEVDGDYFVMVRRFSGSGDFTVTGSNIVLPVLENGMPQVGIVANAGFTYYKVLLPTESTHLTIAVAGNPNALACTAPPVPGLPSVPVCPVFGTVDEIVCVLGPEVCGAFGTAQGTVCPNLSVPGLCGDPDTTNVDLYVRHIDHPVAPRGLPTTALFDCRSNHAASVDSCTFDTELLAQTGNPGNPTQILPSIGPGKIFVGVRGTDGPADYAIVAAYK